MTVLLAWREQEMERVWIVSDSRLSSGVPAGMVRMTDAAAKLLSVPVVLRRPTPLSVLGTPVLSTTIAFAYAGSSLVAMQAYAAILPLWSHLQTSGAERLPSIEEFARHLALFVKTYSAHVSAAYNRFQPCLCALVGFDAASNSIDGWVVETRMADQVEAPVRRMAIAPGEIELLGSGAGWARIELDRMTLDLPPYWRREPLQMMRRHLQTDPQADVGGGIQLGYVQSEGFQLLFDAQPIVPGNPIPAMRFRGFDFSEISSVGQSFVNLPGMA